jgi:hypothetical protein
MLEELQDVTNIVDATQPVELKKHVTLLDTVDIDKTKEEVADMNFIQASTLLKKIDENIKTIENIKAFLEALEEVQDENPDTSKHLNVDMMRENVLAEAGIKYTYEEFIEKYPELSEKLNTCGSILQDKIHEYSEVEKDSAFLTSQLLDSVQKRYKSLQRDLEELNQTEDPDINKRHSLVLGINDMEFMQEVLVDRYNSVFLEERVQNMSSPKDIVKKYNQSPKKIKSKTISLFTWCFSEEQLNGALKVLNDYGKNEKASDMLLYYIATRANKAYTQTRMTYSWYKIFIMNLLDYGTGVLTNPENRARLEQTMDNLLKKFKPYT